MSGQVERLARWPAPGDPGRFVARCSCRRWNAAGTAEEIARAARSHDDSPFRSHVVSIRGKVVISSAPSGAAGEDEA